MEIWREIKGYEGLYEVSDLGQVRRVRFHKKLTVENVETARQLRSNGMIYDEIAGKFDVTQRAIIQALNFPAARPHRVPNRILKPQNSHGYATVNLCKNGKPKGFGIHILVARAFLGRPKGKEINHKNGNGFDARLCNLEYISHQQNARHARDVLKKNFGGDRRSASYRANKA